MTEDRLGRLLRQMTPPVDELGTWETIRDRAGLTENEGIRRSGANPRRLIRPLALVALAVVVLVAVGFGVRALVEHLGQNQSVAIITDDPMSPNGAGSSTPTVDSVYRLKYGQTVNIDGLDITVTVMPTPAPFTDSDPHPISSSFSERDDSELLTRLRSQYIITNTGSEAQTVDLGSFSLLDEGENRYGLMAQTLELEPGVTILGRLDFYVDSGVAANAVVYTTDQYAEDLAVWGSEAITEGPGYPVLQTLPTLRAEDVESIEVQEEDPKGGQPSIETYAPNAAADLETFISCYEQTSLVRSEGYPGYASPVQFTFHLKDGSDLIVGIDSEAEERIVITHSRPGQADNRPSAVGSNPALVNLYFTGLPPSAIMGVGPILSWGEEAVLDGRTIKVEQPVEVPERTIEVEAHLPDETRAPSGYTLAYIAYSLVTITNTGSEPLTCASQEFFGMGNTSGSTGGIGGPGETLAGHEVLDLVTLQPGESVTRAVLFQLKQGDHPVKVLLGTRDSTTGRIYSSTSAWLALWQ